MPQFLSFDDADFEASFAALLSAKREDSPDVDNVVAGIIADVRARGDEAVIDLTAKFDRITLTPDTLRITSDEISDAIDQVSAEDREALELAATRIRAYHERQLPEDAEWVDDTGATLGWRWTAVSAAGLYVPGGLASYPSSVLMNAIPAKVAGVEAPRDGRSNTGRRAQSAGIVGRASLWCRRGLPHRRRTGGRGACLRH